MKKKNRQLADWAVSVIKEQFKDDVCLLLEHRTLKLEKDRNETAFSFYIPAASRANGLARTFMIDGIGYDLFPMSWERMERTADIKEYNTTCLADAEILYARSEDDRRRFISLQARLQANLQNPHYMYNRALKWFDTVTEIFQEMLFESRLYKVREHAGYICDLLSLTVAFVNQTYFKHGQTGQINELQSMKQLPAHFISLYESIVRSQSADEQKRLCHEMIGSTKRFLAEHDKNGTTQFGKPDFSELAAWYHELSYTWRRVYHWCDSNDPVNAYIWCCSLQDEVGKTGAGYGISELDLLSAFDSGNLSGLRKRLEYVERTFIAAIEANGAELEAYKSIEDFLKHNA
ncbi:MAG: hypothetical protein K0R57_2490 [Paenibacillaceae bacterium]|jgi:hypothetical protein|nr:hypothetical protein [Paenibacillaceae bacterium]